MKLTLKIKNLDCAHCAAKMEDKIAKMPQVSSASVSFLLQKIVVECNCENIEAFVQEVNAICKTVDRNSIVTLN